MPLSHVGDGPDLFRPDPVRACESVDTLRARLAGSYRHLLEACQGHLPLPEREIERAIETIEASARIRPDVFIVHRNIVEAALEGDLPAVAAGFGTFCRMPIPARPNLTVRAWGDPSFSEEEARRYQWAFGDEGDTKVVLHPPADAVFAQACEALRQARSLLRRADPALAGEIDALVNEVVFAQGDAGTGMTFDGISAFFASGSLLLNACEHRTAAGALSGLVHEAAHGLIFALGEAASLVENGPDERFPSPLRQDLRPMNGVVHATFVSARIAYALDAVLSAGLLAGDDRAEAEELRAGARRAFDAGYATVKAHARPTELGRALLDGAEAYMAQSRAELSLC